MAQGYFGSICIDDLFTGKIAKGNNGKSYVCLDDLTAAPFNKSAKNSKTYVNIGVYVNDEPDQYQNVAGISLSQSQQEREEKVKKIYIGNLKFAAAKSAAASPSTGTMDQPAPDVPAIDDLPF